MLSNHFKIWSTHFFVLITALSWATDAHAYFDPGTGSMLIQLLMASVLGFMFTLKIYWRKFKNTIKNYLGKKNNDGNRN
jgi:hypothetical protein